MAKIKSGGSPVFLRGSLVQAAANGFFELSLLTGLSLADLDALIVEEVVIEYPDFVWAAVGICKQELCISRATKAAMPVLSDDDILFKDEWKAYHGAAGELSLPGLFRYRPPSGGEPVIIEDKIFAQFKTLNAVAAYTAFVTLQCRPATVTDSEKTGILLSRIN